MSVNHCTVEIYLEKILVCHNKTENDIKMMQVVYDSCITSLVI